jgi:hypothetical protein
MLNVLSSVSIYVWTNSITFYVSLVECLAINIFSHPPLTPVKFLIPWVTWDKLMKGSCLNLRLTLLKVKTISLSYCSCKLTYCGFRLSIYIR